MTMPLVQRTPHFRSNSVDCHSRCAPRAGRKLWDALCACVVAFCLTGGTSVAQESPISQIEAKIASGELPGAADLARPFDDQLGSSPDDPTLVFARLAQAFQKAGDASSAAEFYERSVKASARDAAANLPAERVHLVRLAAAASMLQVKELPKAYKCIAPLLAPDANINPIRKNIAAKLALRAAAMALASSDHDLAVRAYTLVEKGGAESDRPTAMLGAAWALALKGDQPTVAAQRLAAFVDAYPSHDDAARAARACANCLSQAGRENDANVMLADLLRRWPESESAAQVVMNQPDCQAEISQLPPAVREWLLSEAAQSKRDRLDTKMIRLGLLVAAADDAAAPWDAFLLRLMATDHSGQATADTLQQLTELEFHAHAERLAARMISPIDGAKPTPAAREEACRWAGKTQRWSMLSLAAEAESPVSDSETRTVAIERMFAEALTQTGRFAESRAWWNHLADRQGEADFATLLRCAEMETSAGEDVKLAEKRVDAARKAAGDDRFRVSLVDLLDAEVAIRRARFEKARGLLGQVVDARTVDASLRGRAQWMIGETHYLQQDFSDAIESYRKVEAIDAGGAWIAPALIQAGKSFEQLGRTREARVCYAALISRFADSPHVVLAQRRLAAIAPENAPAQSPSQPTIRR